MEQQLATMNLGYQANSLGMDPAKNLLVNQPCNVVTGQQQYYYYYEPSTGREIT